MSFLSETCSKAKVNMIPEPVDLYVVHTPLHILFTINLIQHNAESRSTVIFVFDDFFQSDLVAKRLQLMLGERHKVVRLPGALGHSHQSVSAKLHRHVNAVRALSKARRFYQQCAVERVLVFNDTRREVQAILHDLKHRGTELLYVEDGLEPYREGRRKVNPILTPLLKLIYKGCESITTHGAFSDLDGAILLHPNLANQSLQNKPRYQMPRFVLNSQQVDQLLGLFGVTRKELTEALADCGTGVLICLPNSESQVDGQLLAKRVREITRQYMHRAVIYLKYHPRERTEDPLDLGPQETAYAVPRAVPAELVCAVLGENLSAIYSEVSSILVTSRWINPNIETYSINWSGGDFPCDLLELFTTEGVHFVES